ncbi:MAG: hypothetical protein CSB15_00715 [Clostridiales bacterium]|nr:MAG: hypothetical protein CSB15_00715 [Clostridiales bacterium]
MSKNNYVSGADLIINDSELNKANINIIKYADFLTDSIFSYCQILDEMLMYGIKDEKITSEIIKIMGNFINHQKSIESFEVHFKSIFSKYLDDVSQNDKLKIQGFMVKL